MSICMYLHDIHNLLLKDKFDIVYTNRQGHMCIYNFVLLRMAKIFLETYSITHLHYYGTHFLICLFRFIIIKSQLIQKVIITI